MQRRSQLLVALVLTACGPAVSVAGSETTGGETTTTGTHPPSISTETGATTSTSSTTQSADTTTEGTTDDSGGNAFILRSDGGGGSSIECDIWIDDCPIGQKCMPWASGSGFDSTRCIPIARDANGIGEPCTVEGSMWSGYDDCEAGAVCWDVDPATNEGTCVAFCHGSYEDPACTDGCSTCDVLVPEVIAVCLPGCNPLAQECAKGQACYPTLDSFACSFVPQNSPYAGEPCSAGVDCVASACVPTASLPGCTAIDGCCAPFCDLTADDPCPDAADGITCVPWFPSGQAPSCNGYDTLGVCRLPP